MNSPVRRDAYGVPTENSGSGGFNPEEPRFDESGDEGASAFPLAYAWPEEEPASGYVAEQEAADIEATLLSDLEAAATAFWTDLDPEEDAAALDAGTGAYDEPAADANQFEFHWETTAEDLIGPEARRTLIAFRPPRRRQHDSARSAGADAPTVNFDVHATPDGAFAEDLAARNKEFYDLLKSDSAARKIAVPPGPARGPRFESIFPRAEPAARRHRAPAQHERAGSGLARQAAAAAILAVVVGVGLFIIAQQFAIPATSEEDFAALSDEVPATGPLVPATDPAETSTIPAPDVARPVDDHTNTTTASFDPGTLTTPPLYETPEPAGQPVDNADPAPASSEFATIPLRTETETGISPAPAEAAAVTDDLSTSDSVPLVEDLPEEIAVAKPVADAAPAKPEHEPVSIAAAPAPAKEPRGNTEMLRIPAGTGKVNSAVNMRAGPDNGERVVRVLRAGAPVEIVKCKMWCEIIAGGDRGFVFQRFIDRTGGSARAEPVEPVREENVRAALPEEAEVAPREEARGPLNLLRFGRPNN